jgi:hypothetical protein
VPLLDRKKRNWGQPAEDLVCAATIAATMAGLPMNIIALPDVALTGSTANAAATLPSVVHVPYAFAATDCTIGSLECCTVALKVV